MRLRGSSKVGRCAAARAATYVGVVEQPAGSNRGPLIDEWNTAAGVPPGSPWCMSFVRAVYRLCGVTLGGGASAGNFLAWAVRHGYEVGRPWRGCVVCYDWNGDRWADHVEVVEHVLALRWRGASFVGLVATIGGNTGDAVSRRRRWIQPGWRFALVPDPTT